FSLSPLFPILLFAGALRTGDGSGGAAEENEKDKEEARRCPEREGAQAAGSLAGMSWRSSVMTWSVVTPSLCAVKLTAMRWRRMAWATAAMLAQPTWFWPWMTAWARAAVIIARLARGPAPTLSHLVAGSRASGSPVRVARTRRLA